MESLSSTQKDIYDFVRSTARAVPTSDLLRQPVGVLLGISSGAGVALQKLGINSIFDLASSNVFDNATKIVAAATEPQSSIYRYGRVPADIIDAAKLATIPMNKIQEQPISFLTGVAPSDADSIAAALDVETIRDLSKYPPYLAALRIMNSLYFPQAEATYDPEYPSDLVPTTGQFPIERVQYSTLHMGEIQTATELRDISSPTFEPPSLENLETTDTGGFKGFKTVATGALLTFSQTWFAQGITLGHLLHSCTLAPGESTRVAIVDWSRKESGNQVEGITEQDDLVNSSDHTRAIAEVTTGVAHEAQQGWSGSSSSAWSKAVSTSTTGDVGGGAFASFWGFPSYTTSKQQNVAASTARSDAYSSTLGNREVATQTMQNINDRTHQLAHDSRNRRASVVREVAQSEHEAASTRVIANYNHAHALSINYYEVVQIFRVEVKLAKAEQVIFIPLALPDFSKDGIVRRFRYTLARNALDTGVRDALLQLDTALLVPHGDTVFSALRRPLKEFLTEALTIRSSLAIGSPVLRVSKYRSTAEASPATKDTSDTTAAKAETTDTGTVKPQPPAPKVTPEEAAFPPSLSSARNLRTGSLPILDQTSSALWDLQNLSRLSNLFQTPLGTQTNLAVPLPADVLVQGASVSTAPKACLKPQFKTSTGQIIDAFGPDQNVPALSLRDVDQILLQGWVTEFDFVDATITLTLSRGGVIFPLDLPSVVVSRTSMRGAVTTVVDVRANSAGTNVKGHLVDNRMHYAQAVFRSLDATDLALMLSPYGYKVGGKIVPVTQVINPTPIRYCGNYLAFTTNIQSRKKTKLEDPDDPDPSWTAFLEEHGIIVGDTNSDIVPLGTGGVFAEAILGRANCAEKLDVTRFWNWQESPIPLQPTEIAAIQTNSRATTQDLQPGQLSNALVAQQAPSNLPDPVGTAALLSALQNGNMFRDQSGLAATVGLTQAALQATQQGAATAGAQAASGLQSQLQATTERQRIAAGLMSDLAKVAADIYTGGLAGVAGGLGGLSGGGGGGGQSSKKGEMINYFDTTKDPATADTNGGDSASGGNGALIPSGGSSGSPDQTDKTQYTGISSFSQNPAARAAVGGNSAGLLETIASRFGDVVGLAGMVENQAQDFWPGLSHFQVRERIDWLSTRPEEVSQGSLPLCVDAAFYFIIISTRRDNFVEFGNNLLDTGTGTLGGLIVKPSDKLRRQRYNKIFNTDALDKEAPPQAEWMLLCSLRNSGDPTFMDYTGTLGFWDRRTGGWFIEPLARWLKKTGWFTVNVQENPQLGNLVRLPRAAARPFLEGQNWYVCGVGWPLENPKTFGHHAMVVTSPFTQGDKVLVNREYLTKDQKAQAEEADEAGQISYDWWSWGQKIQHQEIGLKVFMKALVMYAEIRSI
ncbi:hypothetical protein BCR34DRAFT_601160 [Clohesyomyces aquaticus]|uniref:Uncharacterized protein n=1 Tax=Clohesyomyces aquaticus TaxID=1231657 RepID=A0A1Y1ZNB3_9PLEO|nr:hypothetical protein BCR34DRAFT_601160 [Clohesyomyces aquaticus]